MDENKLLEERKEKFMKFLKGNPNWIFYLILILLIILGVYIRMQPLLDHGGNPGLWDVTTNDYTLGPDLDPFLFLRYAKEMLSSSGLPEIDMMRNVPLGFDNSLELQMVSYMIVLTYYFVNIFGNYSVNFAGAFMPVIFFALTIISFFLFVREIFIRKDESESYLKSNIIASISTLFMIILPGFISRTVAGIPEKESVGFFFMFLAFYFFIKAWKSEKLKGATIFGVLAGVSTALMGLTWGGVVYIYATIAIVFFAAMILNKVHKKEAIIYISWILVSLAITFLFTNRFSLIGYATSLDTGLVVINLVILGVHTLVWKTKLHEKMRLNHIKLPRYITSIILSIILLIIITSIVLGPSFIIDKLIALNRTLIQPVYGRWNTTVAENRQPYFTEWLGTFGKFVFWAFVAGSVLLFNKMFNQSKKKQKFILTACYVFFLFGLIFSRYSSTSALLDGEGLISKALYYGSSLLLVCVFGYYYITNYKTGDKSFEALDFGYIFLFVLFILTLFTARSAVRLIMVLVPIAPIFLAYLIAETGIGALKEKDKNMKLIFAAIAIFLLIFSAYQAYGFYKSAKSTAYSYVPSQYTIQWQNAMSWVRDNTPTTAVFAHWWDYGYWVQSIGDRATITDGGNAITWWNYLIGRHVLTGDNQADALEFLYSHSATHLLIDPTDIGKYGAFSQIGSNETYDRLSQGPIPLVSDARNIQETKSEIIRLYNRPSGNNQVSIFPIEDDIIYDNNGTKTYLLKENAGLMGISINYSLSNNGTLLSFNQPSAIFVSKGGNYVTLPMRYLKYQDSFYDFNSGIESAAGIIQSISQDATGVHMDNTGALIYLSPRVFKGMLGQLYILNDPLMKFTNFKLAHSEPSLNIDYLKQQGLNLGEFVYVLNNLEGPIKIWNITYTGNEEVNPGYTQRAIPDYITWRF